MKKGQGKMQKGTPLIIDRDVVFGQKSTSLIKGEIMNYTYIVECGDGSLYTGWTNNLEKRIQAHNAGKGAKYTKSRLPVKLVYSETFDTKEEAMSREYAIKHMKRKEKLRLIAQKNETIEESGTAESQ